MDNLDRVTCPTCGKQGTWTPGNTFRPFCSERCKLIDLGDWASEKNKVPGEPIKQFPDLDNEFDQE